MHKSIYIPLLQDAFISEVLNTAKEIRSIGINCEISLDGTQKLGKQIPSAEKKGYRYLLLIGEEEINNKTAILKDLKTSTQITLQKETLILELQKVLGI